MDPQLLQALNSVIHLAEMSGGMIHAIVLRDIHPADPKNKDAQHIQHLTCSMSNSRALEMGDVKL